MRTRFDRRQKAARKWPFVKEVSEKNSEGEQEGRSGNLANKGSKNSTRDWSRTRGKWNLA